ncbi:hypothetical protein GW17_00013622 [Ensete ventricosum]|nr:hypothetical protein GW17_00013622 [Ensete ventricosum]
MRRSTWEARLKVFRSLGWSEEEFRIAFQRTPLFVLVSEPKMRKMVQFLMVEVKLKASNLSREPRLLMYGLENRLLPRFSVFRLMEAKGLVKDGSERKRNSLVIGMFTCSVRTFLEKYVQRYSEVAPELMDVYNGRVH